jgi:hypothetical protein
VKRTAKLIQDDKCYIRLLNSVPVDLPLDQVLCEIPSTAVCEVLKYLLVNGMEVFYMSSREYVFLLVSEIYFHTS